jgi:hypothetical protein
MRKRRGDSPWSRLTVEERKQMDKWYFDENLSYPEILEKAGKEFGVQASKQTLTAYFRHREEVVAGGAGWEDCGLDDPRARRVGAGMSWGDLESRALHSAAMAVYEMSLAEPDKMRVKEIRSLMKMLNEHRRLALDRKTREEKMELQVLQLAAKVASDNAKGHTLEEFEEIMMAAKEILHRKPMKSAEEGAECEAEKAKPEAEGDNGGPVNAHGEERIQAERSEEAQTETEKRADDDETASVVKDCQG